MKTHTITINQDMICEDESTEFFYSSLSLDTSVYDQISLSLPQVRVNIDESEEAECSKEAYLIHLFFLSHVNCFFLHCLPVAGFTTVGYEAEMYTATESQSEVELSIIITDPPTGGAPRPFSLSLSTGDNIAGRYIPICNGSCFISGSFFQQLHQMTMNLRLVDNYGFKLDKQGSRTQLR